MQINESTVGMPVDPRSLFCRVLARVDCKFPSEMIGRIQYEHLRSEPPRGKIEGA